jgi:hypothetical protein
VSKNKEYALTAKVQMTIIHPQNATSSRAVWGPIFQTSKNSNFKVSKKFKKIQNNQNNILM